MSSKASLVGLTVGDIKVLSGASTTNVNAFTLLNSTWSAPAPIGNVTPATGAFTTLSASGQISSTVATGTAPLSILSTTVNPNLNSALLLGATWSAPLPIGNTTPSTGAFTALTTTTVSSGQITSTVTTGTAPFVIASNTLNANLNSALLLGATWGAPLPIGNTTASTGAFTTISATGQISSTVATGVAPLTILSTTLNANLNSALLLGATWGAPLAIGNTTPSTAAFTTISATGQISSTLATGTSPLSVLSTTIVANLNSNFLQGATWDSPLPIGSTVANTGAFSTLTGNVINSANSASIAVNLSGANTTTTQLNLAGTLNATATTTTASISTAGGIYSALAIRAVSGYIGSTTGTTKAVGFIGEFPTQTATIGTNGSAYYISSTTAALTTATTLVTYTLPQGVYIVIGSVSQTVGAGVVITANLTIGGTTVYTTTGLQNLAVCTGFTITGASVVVTVTGSATTAATAGNNIISICRVG